MFKNFFKKNNFYFHIVLNINNFKFKLKILKFSPKNNENKYIKKKEKNSF